MEKSNVSIIDVNEAKKEILNGNLVSFPTETVYGLGANVENDKAVLKIYTAKGRPLSNPVIAHVNSINMASKYLKDPPNDIMKLMMNKFWPGPLTIVSDANMSIVPLIVTANTKTIGIRCPDHPIALDLITKCNVGIAAPSANISGNISPTNPYHVYEDFGEEIKLIVDGGQSEKGVESTVVDVRSNDIIILRDGPITQKMLENKVDCKIKKKGSNKNILSPGQMFKHYSPSKKLIINSIKPTKNCSFLGFNNIMPDEKFDGIALNLSIGGDLNEAASNLFKMLRFLDKTDTQEIVVAPIPNKDVGLAINDKLKRASS